MEQTKTFKLPSGKVVTIREPNGDDDSLLTRIGDIMNGDNFSNFIASITIKDSDLNVKPTAEDVNDWKNNDRTAFLLKQRIWVYGEDLEFEHICSNPDCENCKKKVEVSYSENITKFDTDFDKLEGLDVGPDAVPPYKNGNNKVIEYEIPGFSKFRFHSLTNRLEKEYNKLVPLNERSSNSVLLMRNLERSFGSEWKKVTFFADIPSKKMAQLRNWVMDSDAQWSPVTDVPCNVCGQVDRLNIFLIPGFYFPEVKM